MRRRKLLKIHKSYYSQDFPLPSQTTLIFSFYTENLYFCFDCHSNLFFFFSFSTARKKGSYCSKNDALILWMGENCRIAFAKFFFPLTPSIKRNEKLRQEKKKSFASIFIQFSFDNKEQFKSNTCWDLNACSNVNPSSFQWWFVRQKPIQVMVNNQWRGEEHKGISVDKWTLLLKQIRCP